MEEITEIRVSATTNNKSLAKSMNFVLAEGKRVCLIAIGERAVNQAVKSFPLLNQLVANQGIWYSTLVTMEDRVIQESTGPAKKTCIKFLAWKHTR